MDQHTDRAGEGIKILLLKIIKTGPSQSSLTTLNYFLQLTIQAYLFRKNVIEANIKCAILSKDLFSVNLEIKISILSVNRT